LLSTPGTAEQLRVTYAGKKTSEKDRQTPLIIQAKEFALRIDPPPPPPPPVRSTPSPGIRRPQASVSAKFKLVGTSYHIGDEGNSWALIDEVGKGWHWVKLGGVVGHLKIEKIGSGVVLIRDGTSTYELTAERKQKPDYVKSYTGTDPNSSTPGIWHSSGESTNQVFSAESTQNQAVPVVTKEQVESNIEWLKKLQENPEALGMTAEEAEEIAGFGDMLDSLEAEAMKLEPNTAPAEETNSATDVNAAKEGQQLEQMPKVRPGGRPVRTRRLR
ncbi:MAG: hypothetical protein PHP01_05135, partial [Phycisphaerae bacterium]|nr:hypothetical protein [Phycisphaerae bacterium]